MQNQSIQSISLEERSEEETKAIFDQIKAYTFFDKFSSDEQRKLLNQIVSRSKKITFKENETIQKKNDCFTQMFCILNGIVGVFHVEQEKKNSKEKLELIKKIQENQCFGEQCLSSKSDQKWEYKCFSDECVLLSIQRKELKRLFSSIKKEQIMENLKFFSSLNAFSDYNSNLLLQIYSNSIEIKLQRNNCVFQEGDESNHVYIIKSGSFLVKQYINFSFNQMNQEQDRDDNQKFQNNQQQQINKLLQKKKASTKQQKIVIWGEKEIFGEEDVIANKNRTYSIYCESQQGEIIKISKDFFISNIMQEESSKEVILSTLEQKLKEFQQKQENAHKQLYGSQLSKFYSQITQNQVESTPREVPQNSKIELQQNTQKSSISNTQKISFKDLIKQKLIGSDINLNLSNYRKENGNQNQQNLNQKLQQQQIIPNINELINSSQIISQGEQTNRHSSPSPVRNNSLNKSINSPQSNKKQELSNNSATSFSQYAQNNQVQPCSNKSLLETIKKSNFKDSQKEQFQNELQKLAIFQPSDCIWLQNEIEKVNQEIVPKEMLLPPEPYCTDAKIMETTPQVKKLYHELKRNYFKKYEGKSKKTFQDFAQMRHYIKHRGIVQMIEEEMARKKEEERTHKTQSLQRAASISPQRQGFSNEAQSESERRVNNIIKNKILKGNSQRFSQFRSQSIDLAFQFPKTAMNQYENEQFENDKLNDNQNQYNLLTNDSTEKSSAIQSPGRKIIKMISTNSDFGTNQKNHVWFQEDQLCNQANSLIQNKREEEHNLINSMPELDSRSNKMFSFTIQTQNSIAEINSPFSSMVFDTIEKQQSNKNELVKIPHKLQTIFPCNQSLPTSPLKQRSLNNSQCQDNGNITPFNANLKKKFYVLKQRSTSPRKQQQIKANSLSSIQIQQMKQEPTTNSTLNSNINSNQKQNNQQTQTEQFPISQFISTEQDVQTERLKLPIRSKSQIQYPQTPSTTSRSLRITKFINRSQSPCTNRGVSFLNFSEICSKIENIQNPDNPQQKAQTERNSQSQKNILQYNIKSNVLRQSAQQYLNMNNDLSKYTQNQKGGNDKVQQQQSNSNCESQSSLILKQNQQNHLLKFKDRIKEQSQKLLIIQQNIPQQIKNEGNQEEQQKNEKNQHFSITNKFFDRLEKKRKSDSKQNKQSPSQNSISNRSGYCNLNLNYHNNNTILSSSSAAVAKLVLQKRLISNFGNSELLNNLDLTKLKKTVV
ncbi:cyclic nucleotide-binding domain protein (macronuclear) [Tetrahymena thermophila SB210]|uniref:Cyclic nucleotide-binding domain protein n=1 Tax=Tetrahymena thermophila (strain SB210) TaxID=312017 RepID=I7M1U9_TETTS|nr:cyclic nucleotide-binding domain protein [Tetrahymena thermophila SB210]EAR97825.2 cyclic nucleotide-binding domain protein [Tetrahymena thermophila SB210]|eukprot:XP_001018070.2 cyclic nucleotide-binding domain protein [Tetrahymena thermophila SB210]